jgi:hypothetical protein
MKEREEEEDIKNRVRLQKHKGEKVKGLCKTGLLKERKRREQLAGGAKPRESRILELRHHY